MLVLIRGVHILVTRFASLHCECCLPCELRRGLTCMCYRLCCLALRYGCYLRWFGLVPALEAWIICSLLQSLRLLGLFEVVNHLQSYLVPNWWFLSIQKFGYLLILLLPQVVSFHKPREFSFVVVKGSGSLRAFMVQLKHMLLVIRWPETIYYQLLYISPKSH